MRKSLPENQQIPIDKETSYDTVSKNNNLKLKNSLQQEN